MTVSPTHSTPLHVLVGPNTIDETDQRRLAGLFPDLRFTFAANPEEALAAAPSAEIVFSKPVDFVTTAPDLRWLQAGTAGVDRALAVLKDRNVPLTNARGAHGIPMAENVLTMALCFATRMHRFIRTQPQHARISREVIAEKWELDGQTMLILGLGDIGGTLAQKASDLGLHVLGVRRSSQPHSHCAAVYTPDRLHEVLPLADHVACCLPLTGETRAIISEPELRLMKATAHVYNVGRGASIEGTALRRALSEGWIAGAGLDCVDPTDTPAPDDPIWDMDNVILSQHSSGSSPYNSRRITDIFADNLHRYLEGRPLTNVVDRELGY